MSRIPIHVVINLFWTILLFSCASENELSESLSENGLNLKQEISRVEKSFLPGLSTVDLPPALQYEENIQDLMLRPLTAREECTPTKFSEAHGRHFSALAEDSLVMANLDRYLNLNRYASILNKDREYFGANGEYTRLVFKVKKDLERFWRMSNQVVLHGQHNETLNDREKLADLFWILLADLESKEDVYPIVDEMLYYNSLSPLLPESPVFSSDGLSSKNGRIIIGDGLAQLFIEAGIAPQIVWTGILSHEWAHQIQMNHLDSWYPEGTFDTTAERTRLLELEADFFSAYYLTHKRGATLNWKRVNQFFELFFQSGDCGFDLPFHHGTPHQRQTVAEAGYQLAKEAHKQGHILSPNEIHQIFLARLANICPACSTDL